MTETELKLMAAAASMGLTAATRTNGYRTRRPQWEPPPSCRRRRRTGSGGCSRMVRPAESRRARTIPRRSPLTRVTEALSIATSVPVPIAIPTWAVRQGGGVVDAVAGHGDDATLKHCRSFDHHCIFLLRAARPAITSVDVPGWHSRPIPRPWFRLSPVSMTMRRPSRGFRCRDAHPGSYP